MGEINITEQVLDCSFCGISEGDVEFLVEGEGVYICDVCVDKANDIVKKNLQNNFYSLTFNLQTPKDIKLMLDQHIIGQDIAKQTVAVSVYNHYKLSLIHI